MKGEKLMIKERLQMIKSKYELKGDKKKIENMVILIIILIVTLITINSIWGNSETVDENKQEG
jgi:beta-lactamase regulating signal transducer with metallopeptidase domain